MKKRLPLMLSMLGIFIIGAAASLFFFSGKADKSTISNTGPAQPAPAKAAPQPAKADQPNKAPENKKPDIVMPDTKPQSSPDKARAAGVYEYNAKGKRDPFITLIVKPETDKKKGFTPIENYEIAEFKLIAVLWNNTGYYAVITLPDGKSYTIKEGTKMGLHGGKVYKITKNSVVIREQLRDQRGALKPKDTILKLRREEEG